MNIAIIGTGHVGSALGRRWAQQGHQIVFGSRTPESERVQDLVALAGPTASAAIPQHAVVDAEVIVLAVPYASAQQMLATLGDLQGKILIDPINPIRPGGGGLTIGTDTSAGEQIAGWAKGARVVKAFNMICAPNMSNPDYGEQKLTIFLCGDDVEAKAVVTDLTQALDFDVVDCGTITASRYLEPMAMLLITLIFRQKMGFDIGFALLHRPGTV